MQISYNGKDYDIVIEKKRSNKNRSNSEKK